MKNGAKIVLLGVLILTVFMNPDEGDESKLEMYERLGWLCESKKDGTSAQLHRHLDGRIEIRARNRKKDGEGEDYAKVGNMPDIVAVVEKFPLGTWVQTELVGLNNDGIIKRLLSQSRCAARLPSTIQKAMREVPYFRADAYDIMEYAGRDVTQLPYVERKLILQNLVGEIHDPKLTYIPHISNGFKEFYQLEPEGVVVKRADSPYVHQDDSPYWLKIKHRTRFLCETVGFQKNDGGRNINFFRALVYRVIACEHTQYQSLCEDCKHVRRGKVGVTQFNDADKAKYTQLLNNSNPHPCSAAEIGEFGEHFTSVDVDLKLVVSAVEVTESGTLFQPIKEAIYEPLRATCQVCGKISDVYTHMHTETELQTIL